ncbi:hypothetical protein M885DRAFT_167453 [Pelagophyceae sp. CCMP2097]|nr:hypothetical protein M885DRAFT_167453 [Pelagophyceae sp. CCMP2097]
MVGRKQLAPSSALADCQGHRQAARRVRGGHAHRAPPALASMVAPDPTRPRRFLAGDFDRRPPAARRHLRRQRGGGVVRPRRRPHAFRHGRDSARLPSLTVIRATSSQDLPATSHRGFSQRKYFRFSQILASTSPTPRPCPSRSPRGPHASLRTRSARTSPPGSGAS